MNRSMLIRNLFNTFFLSTVFIGMPTIGFAMELIVDDLGPDSANTQQGIRVKTVKAVYPRATTADVMCGKTHHMVRFRLNGQHAGLPFSVTAKKMTRIKIRWDHPDKVLFPFPEKRKTIVFPHAGGESRVYFRAYEPVSGNVYIMDDQDVVIKTCPYSFLPAKRYRQAINVNVNETEYDPLNDTLEYKNNNVSVNYRISTRTAVPDGATWSWSLGLSQSESSTDNRRINSNFSYNW